MADEIAQVIDLEYKGIYYLLKGTKAMIAAMVSGVKSLHQWHHQKWLNKPGSCSWQKIQEASEGMAPILEFPKEMFEPTINITKPNGEMPRNLQSSLQTMMRKTLLMLLRGMFILIIPFV